VLTGALSGNAGQKHLIDNKSRAVLLRRQGAVVGNGRGGLCWKTKRFDGWFGPIRVKKNTEGIFLLFARVCFAIRIMKKDPASEKDTPDLPPLS
jgi:hypothetical protein